MLTTEDLALPRRLFLFVCLCTGKVEKLVTDEALHFGDDPDQNLDAGVFKNNL